MANIPINVSAPFQGLGTASATVAATGLYNCEFKSFIPFQAAGGQPPTTVPSPEITDVTCAADTAGSRNNTYWTFYTAGDLYGYYVWYNINSAGTDPAVSGLTGIEVAGATGATASTLAGASRTAIAAAVPYVSVSGATSHVIITNKSPGQSTNAANGAGGSSAGASFSITQGSYGDPAISGLNVVIKNNSTVLARYGWPSPTQPILGGNVSFQATAGDVVSVVLSSSSAADSALNAVKSIVNLYQGF
jgi:hypothetical protein